MTRATRAVLVALACAPAALRAQSVRALSLDEALRVAVAQSDALHIAEAGVLRARGQVLQARAQYLPQLGASVNYTRTLKSQFEALRGSAAPTPPPTVPPVPPTDTTTYYSPCLRYLAGSGATQAEKVVGLETYARCAAGTGFSLDFSKVGFGSENQYQIGLQGTFTLYSGGRVQAQNAAARAGERSADVEVASQRAKLALDVTEAYFNAVLADRLVAISESSLVQTESVLKQTTLARQVGNQSEFDLLRAQVTRDNQMPQLISARTSRELAYLQLKQLLSLDLAAPVSLTTSLADDRALLQLTGMELRPTAEGADTSVAHRAPVRQLVEAMRAQESQLRAARSQYIPTITLTSQYGRVAFPKGGVPSWSNFLSNWTVTLGATFPLFTGGRISGDKLVAEAGVRESQARLDQVRKLAAVDARQAIYQLEQADAALAASIGTAEQAAKAYSIADVRYREGISTQIELNDSRILLQQAAANRASAVRNLQVARMRIALLRDLPLGAGSSNSGGFGGFGGAGGQAGGAGLGAPGGSSGSNPQGAPPRAASSAASVQPPGSGQ